MSCKVHQHKDGFQVVDVTENSRSTVRVFLSALKFFYGVMVNKKYYPFENNPLIDVFSLHVISTSKDFVEHNDAFPRMPSISGTEEPKKRKRLSDSYFRLQGEKWVPQIVDDVKLPGLILLGGSRLKGWGLREECITRILFESGGRVSEVLGLTLGDWHNRGLLKEAHAFNKGSNGRRVKFLRWNNETTKLLLRYFDTERYRHDPNHLKLSDFLRMKQRKEIDLQSVSLFLSNRGTTFTSKTYRENYWKPACKNAGIDADVHQARHWYVTMAMRTIYETTDNNNNIQRKLRELIEYMKWKKVGK
ncbi:tyrosine-type recombinase/integrase [Brevibacillus sp. AG]|uniref:tyrosine-type recombinase/integrase n=1 Tax=Brevibacillus sp. AG TaxID=3020891 RepID=UPI000853BA53|nr:tyrosine-type recombinase/integrase [Brevibacillus sp. AG]MDC0765083.1 tyrosine-type recombinase/integrase [Brevibacillus sp. AG]